MVFRVFRSAKTLGLAGGVLLVLIAAVVAWPRPTAPAFRTAVVERGQVERTIVAVGKIRPARTVEVGAEVSGLVSAVLVDVNTEVRAGQTLAEIEPTRLDAAVRQAEASIAVSEGALQEAEASIAREQASRQSARAALSRAARLADQGLVSAMALENAQTALEQAEAGVAMAQAQRRSRLADLQRATAQREDARTSRSRARIVSPIDGVVIARSVELGQTIASSFQAPRLFQIATDLGDMRMEVAVNEADIAEVRIGQQVRFQVEAYPDETFRGEVVQLQPQATESQNITSFMVLVAFQNTGNKLRSGMSTTAEIVTKSADRVLRVPSSALSFTPTIEGAGKARIENVSIRLSPRLTGGQPTPARRVTRDDRATQAPASTDRIWREGSDGAPVAVPVQVGVRGDEFVEILSGDIQAGEKILVGVLSPSRR